MEIQEKKHSAGKKSIFFLLLALIFILTSIIYERGVHTKSSPENIVENFQKAFDQSDKILNSLIDSLSIPKYFNDDSLTHQFVANDISTNFAFYIFKYKDSKLSYWTDNTPPLFEYYTGEYKDGQMIRLSNGIYYYRDKYLGDDQYLVALILIKHEFPYQNIYLENRFHDAFSVPGEANISFESGDYNILNPQGEFVCSIDARAESYIHNHQALFLLLFYAIAFLAISAAIFQFYQKFKSMLRSDLLMVLAFSIDIIILRAVMFFFKLPSGLYSSPYFKPGSYAASDYIPSLGDFFLNGLALLVITYVLFITYNNLGLGKKKPKARRYFLIFSLFLHIFIFYRLFLWASESLIMDSSYSMNLNQIFFLTPDSFLALFTFTLLLFSFFLVSYRILGLAMHHAKHSAWQYFLFFLLTSAVYFVICYWRHECHYILFLPLLIYILVFYFLRNPKTGIAQISFSSVVIYLFLFSILGTVVLSYYNDNKELENRRLLAIQLASGEDPLSEYIFSELRHEMHLDTALYSLLADAPYDYDSEELFIQYLEEKYLERRLNKYEWMITVCTPDRALIIQTDTTNCKAYFIGVIDEFCEPAYGQNLYRYDNDLGSSNYISDLEFILNEGADTVYVFIEFFSFFIPGEGLGYPELLIDEKVKRFTGLERYSYAMYKEGKLTFKYGEYPYRTNFQIYKQDTTDVFFDHNNKNHYLSSIQEGEYLLITHDEPTLLEHIAPLSYLLIFFTLFLISFLIAVNIPFSQTLFELNFRNRLQIYIISLIIISFVIIGAITVSYVISLNTTKNKEILQEKTHSVLIELEHKLATEPQLTPDMEEHLTNLLIKFSKVFFSDINLYDLDGKLLASSRPLIFEKQLISKRMNTDAFRGLVVDRKLMYLHTETIGDQDYYSAYVPFRNQENNVVAYLNLPYFARQTELQSEISAFLNAFLNVYVLMTAVAILIALLISRFTTQPLQLIRDKMRGLSLDGVNEKINWSRKDEIGTLIAEYNRMIDELSRSAELLAKSERESAWREMAKQVAHEIKNPLTPMKLSVQYLQKAWDEKSDDWEKRLNRFTQAIIEHIDTLSAIATEFSDFAKMPQKKESKIDLSASIQNSLDLYSDIENIRFTFTEFSEEPHFVLADKNQLIRVFNNLLQNSVQAIGKQKDGSIDISIDLDEKEYIIRVSDNGPGIPEDMMDKIFSPSFTTKTSGMGLGLALVRSIIHEAGGEISFESSPNKGTSFLIHLPVYSDDAHNAS